MRNDTVSSYLDTFEYMTDKQLYKLNPYDIKVRRGLKDFDSFKEALTLSLSNNPNYKYDAEDGVCSLQYKKFDYDYTYLKLIDVYISLIKDIKLNNIVAVMKSGEAAYPSVLTFFQINQRKKIDDETGDEEVVSDSCEFNILTYMPGQEVLYNNLLESFNSSIVVYVDSSMKNKMQDLNYSGRIIYVTIKDNGSLAMASSISEF